MVRTFDDRPIPDALLERMLANARRAPSAGFSQGWGFLVLRGPAETARYWEATLPPARRGSFKRPELLRAPALIVCLSNKSRYLDRYAEPDKGRTGRDERDWPIPYWHVDAGMAALLILLTAVDTGLGACFFGVPRAAPLRAAFRIPEAYEPVGTVAVGYAAPHDRPSPSLARGRRPSADVVRYGQWL